MGEASRIAQVPAHTLRYWEAGSGLLRPARRASGHRRYTREDMETIFTLKELLLERRMTLAGARKAMVQGRRKRPSGSEGDKDSERTLKLLRELRGEIRELLKLAG